MKKKVCNVCKGYLPKGRAKFCSKICQEHFYIKRRLKDIQEKIQIFQSSVFVFPETRASHSHLIAQYSMVGRLGQLYQEQETLIYKYHRLNVDN